MSSSNAGVTDRDVSALAHLAVRLRADTVGCCTWDLVGVVPVFTRTLIGKNLQIATELVLAVATDPTAKTPGAISRPFTPERRPVVESLHPTPATACTRCGGFKGSCPCTHESRAYDAQQSPAPAATGPSLRGGDIYRAAAGLPLKTSTTEETT